MNAWMDEFNFCYTDTLYYKYGSELHFFYWEIILINSFTHITGIVTMWYHLYTTQHFLGVFYSHGNYKYFMYF